MFILSQNKDRIIPMESYMVEVNVGFSTIDAVNLVSGETIILGSYEYENLYDRFNGILESRENGMIIHRMPEE